MTPLDREPDYIHKDSGSKFWFEELIKSVGDTNMYSKMYVSEEKLCAGKNLKFNNKIQEAYMTWLIERALFD